MNVIPCVSWVKRGIAAAIPEKVQLTAKELENIIKQTQAELKNDESDSENEETEEAVSKFVSKEKSKQVGKKSLTDPIGSDEYNFDHYDEETDNVHCHIRNIAVFGEDGKDPLVTKDESEEDSEKEDDIIKHDDNLILVGHVEDDASILEVYVYNEREGSLYCHHDMLLPSFPLCIEWLNFDIADSKPGNLCAIGNMTPIIEIWDLDLMDGLEPAYKLGRKPSKKKKQKRIGHRDAVLDLAWNLNYTHILASGSVDQTILLWDLENTSPVTKLDSFGEKVQSLQWHPTETHQLLTGCADKMVRLFDCKVENNLKTWQTSGEVERVLWNHFDNNYCFASTDNGYIEYFDVRNDKPLWQINAHAKEVTGLCLSSTCAGLLVSSSNDGVIKVWDITDPKELVLVWEKKTNLGAVQCLSSNPDNPFVFAMGGDNRAHNFQVMDFSQNSEVHDRFKNNVVSNFDKAENEKKVEMMEVTEDMSSMDLNTAVPLIEKVKKKKKKKCDD